METLVVPVRVSPMGTMSPMTARRPDGTCVGLAFSSLDALEAVQPGRVWTRLSVSALHEMLAPIGITTVQVDPQLVIADLLSSAPDHPAFA